MTDASVHAKQIFRRWIVNAPSSGRQHERRGSKQLAMNDRLFQSKLWWKPPHPTTPRHCALTPLNHPLLTRGPAPSWHRGWHRFCWHGDRPLLEKEALGLAWPEKSCCISSTGYTLSCVTLCDIVSVCGVSGCECECEQSVILYVF